VDIEKENGSMINAVYGIPVLVKEEKKNFMPYRCMFFCPPCIFRSW
jgi:hypothetical protein